MEVLRLATLMSLSPISSQVRDLPRSKLYLQNPQFYAALQFEHQLCLLDPYLFWWRKFSVRCSMSDPRNKM